MLAHKLTWQRAIESVHIIKHGEKWLNLKYRSIQERSNFPLNEVHQIVRSRNQASKAHNSRVARVFFFSIIISQLQRPI